ncbi:hypothetical protein PISL3812_09161 [Talaromyces islandicus]|uniref:NADP-dependent oxidoreductase domain-containing protein n=1 Tax=Talaromyces islandicus TaxID=28573 RepID=A0A0U1MAZ3_TALIS|nr:hypothetical protein PISL3812_09161 [Talaromyces islandicus]
MAPKLAHVNMMTDTVVANLPPEALRSIIRSLLASQPGFTIAFEENTRAYLQSTSIGGLSQISRESLGAAQTRIRCMLGCGLCYESLPVLGSLVENAKAMDYEGEFLQSIDADIVQAATAVQKSLPRSTDEKTMLNTFYDTLTTCHNQYSPINQDFPFERGLMAIANLLGRPTPTLQTKTFTSDITLDLPPAETFQLGSRQLPRLFSGLWQLSSPAWGAASISKILQQFTQYTQNGFTAFDMADHYGDAEIIFGRFRSSYLHRKTLFAATKFCVFQPMTITSDVVQANVAERCRRLQVDQIDLLQFHWQSYEDSQYINALKYLEQDDRVGMLGLCNFDTEHMQRVIDSGVTIYSNQVQFSLIDSRPVVKMGAVCEKHNVKLLTYGTLCGGFLAEKWLGKAEPRLYDSDITPSQRKYYTMILSWGNWVLFQELLETLYSIGRKHNVSISNVATRWVLDFAYVGAVIVGARMGVSEHVDENRASFGWSMDKADQEAIEVVLKRSRRLEMFEVMGDCGGEYR